MGRRCSVPRRIRLGVRPRQSRPGTPQEGGRAAAPTEGKRAADAHVPLGRDRHGPRCRPVGRAPKGHATGGLRMRRSLRGGRSDPEVHDRPAEKRYCSSIKRGGSRYFNLRGFFLLCLSCSSLWPSSPNSHIW